MGEALDESQVPRIFRAMATRAGLSAKIVRRISGHSGARVGAAQDMIASGIATPPSCRPGSWESASMVQRYGERLLAQRNGAAQLARRQNRAVSASSPGVALARFGHILRGHVTPDSLQLSGVNG